MKLGRESVLTKILRFPFTELSHRPFNSRYSSFKLQLQHYSIYICLSRNTIHRYTCNVKVMGYILHGSVNGNFNTLVKTDSPPSFIKIGEPNMAVSPC